MRSLLRKTTTPQRAIIAAFVLIALIFSSVIISRVAAAASAEATPATGRLVNIYDRGVEKVILTKAQTVEDAIKDAGITLDPKDAVDPTTTTKISSADFKVNIYRARPVVVVDGTIREKVMTPYQTPEQIAKDANITLYDEDKTTVSLSDDIVATGAGLVMTIQRATPITFVQYGKTITVRTQATTVGDMLKEKGIVLAKDDTLSVPVSTPITAGMTVELWRNGVQTLTQDEDIPFDTQQIQDADQPVGYKAVQTPGVVGKKTVSYQIEMKNGQELSRQEIQSVTTSEPKKQVEVVGTKFTYTGGPLSEAQITALGMCESGMTPTRNSGNGFYGAFQFTYSTWKSYNNTYEYAYQAPLDVQKQAVQDLLSRSSIYTQFPGCARKMQAQGIL